MEGTDCKCLRSVSQREDSHISANGTRTMSSRDPFFIVKDEIESLFSQLERSYNKWDRLPEGNSERVMLGREVASSCESLSWQVDEMDRAVSMAEKEPSRFNLAMDEIARRKDWASKMRSNINKITLSLEAAKGQAARAAHASLTGTAASKLEGALIKENDDFIASQQESQQMLLRKQDENLDELSGAVTRLGQVGLTIGEELQTQADLLEEMEYEVDDTQSRLKAARRKLEKVIKKSGTKGQCTIIFVLTILLVILVVVAFN